MLYRILFLLYVVIFGWNSAEVKAQHGPSPESALASILAIKSACDELVPGYAQKYKDPHQKWISQNAALVKTVMTARHEGKSYKEFAEHVQAEFRRQNSTEKQWLCAQIVSVYTTKQLLLRFDIDSADSSLAPWVARSFNGISYDGIEIWFVHAKDLNDNPAVGSQHPVVVCLGLKPSSKEEFLTVKLADTELTFNSKRYRARAGNIGPLHRFKGNTDDADVVGPSNDPVLRRGYFQCSELTFEVATPTTNTSFTIQLPSIGARSRQIRVPVVSFTVKDDR